MQQRSRDDTAEVFVGFFCLWVDFVVLFVFSFALRMQVFISTW